MIDNDLRARQTLAKAAIRAAEWLGLDQEAVGSFRTLFPQTSQKIGWEVPEGQGFLLAVEHDVAFLKRLPFEFDFPNPPSPT